MDLEEFKKAYLRNGPRESSHYINGKAYGNYLTDIHRFVNEESISENTNLLMEECAELIKAASKLQRHKTISTDDRFSILEEMADVRICIDTMLVELSITKYDLYSAMTAKMKRNIERLETEESGNA